MQNKYTCAQTVGRSNHSQYPVNDRFVGPIQTNATIGSQNCHNKRQMGDVLMESVSESASESGADDLELDPSEGWVVYELEGRKGRLLIYTSLFFGLLTITSHLYDFSLFSVFLLLF